MPTGQNTKRNEYTTLPYPNDDSDPVYLTPGRHSSGYKRGVWHLEPECRGLNANINGLWKQKYFTAKWQQREPCPFCVVEVHGHPLD